MNPPERRRQALYNCSVGYDELSRIVERALAPYGRDVWFQVAVDPEDPDVGVGLAIRREAAGDAPRYAVVFFRVLPREPVGPGSAEAWDVEVGLNRPFDTPEEARDEARDLARYLPRPAFLKDERAQNAVFDAIDEALAEEAR